MRILFNEFVRQLTHKHYYFMNLMNVYEVRILKANFEKVVVWNGELMKWLCSKSALRFINFVSRGIYE